VLLIEDDDIFLKACNAVLMRAGFAVDAISDPLLALDRIRAQRYGAIVSDIRMPNSDGISVLKMVRAYDPTIPFVLMTGAPSLETAMSAVEFGAMRYLQKPFNVDELVAVVNEAMERQLQQPRATDAEQLRLTAALSQLWMAYQPIVRWSSRAAVAYEALVRTTSRDVSNPLELIELAERTSRVHELGRTVRATVAKEISARPKQLFFVNLHPEDLLDESLFDPAAPLSAWAKQVVLEVTERSDLAHWEELPAAIQRLRGLGYRVAVDDLGAGYAGLTTFARVEPEFVKLDGSLIRNMDTSATQRRIVKSVVDMARELNIEVVAEAIETMGERQALTAMGLDLMQGYWFAKPSAAFTDVRPAALADEELAVAV
jgi:EAL domain-containing protein (putative c-di-GMP-specific phosphodiesterase class I)